MAGRWGKLSLVPEDLHEQKHVEEDDENLEPNHDVAPMHSRSQLTNDQLGSVQEEQAEGMKEEEEEDEHQPVPIREPFDSGHGWFVSFVARKIDIPRGLWLSVQEQRRNAMSEHGESAMQPRKSIYGLSLMSPYHPVCLTWMTMMLLFDLIYTVRHSGHMEWA